jgi:hypothetical protein
MQDGSRNGDDRLASPGALRRRAADLLLIRDHTADPELRDILLQMAQARLAEAEAVEAAARRERREADLG